MKADTLEFCFVSSTVALTLFSLGSILLTDGAVRRAVQFSLARRIGGLFSPEIIVVGDSLAVSCPWKRLIGRPFGVLNLAAGGATLKEIGGQIYASRGVVAPCLLINGGLNDLLFDDAPTDRIQADFIALTRRIENRPIVVVTLMPFVEDPAKTKRIVEANEVLLRLCRERGYLAVDLNPAISAGGVRRPDMTNDGLHFTRAAELTWIGAIRSTLSEAKDRL